MGFAKGIVQSILQHLSVDVLLDFIQSPWPSKVCPWKIDVKLLRGTILYHSSSLKLKPGHGHAGSGTSSNFKVKKKTIERQTFIGCAPLPGTVGTEGSGL